MIRLLFICFSVIVLHASPLKFYFRRYRQPGSLHSYARYGQEYAAVMMTLPTR